MCPFSPVQVNEDPSWRSDHRGRHAFSALNTYLSNAGRPNQFSEDELAYWLEQVEDNPAGSGSAHWLCLARLAEAALLTAGARADEADFRGATDLLANPRRINVHYLETSSMVRKKRHTPLSVQFFSSERTPQETLHRLAQKTMLHQAEDALLPALRRRLWTSSLKDQTYLTSLRKRMERVADVLNFLACDGIFSPQELQARLNRLPSEKRKWYISQLCNFHPGWFWHLGRALASCLQNPALHASSLR